MNDKPKQYEYVTEYMFAGDVTQNNEYEFVAMSATSPTDGNGHEGSGWQPSVMILWRRELP